MAVIFAIGKGLLTAAAILIHGCFSNTESHTESHEKRADDSDFFNLKILITNG